MTNGQCLVQSDVLDNGSTQQLQGKNHLIMVGLDKVLRELPIVYEVSESYHEERPMASWADIVQIWTILDATTWSLKNRSYYGHHCRNHGRTHHSDVAAWHHKKSSSRTHMERSSHELSNDRPHVEQRTNQNREGLTHTQVRKGEETTMTYNCHSLAYL